jgi:hypothetical protein
MKRIELKKKILDELGEESKKGMSMSVENVTDMAIDMTAEEIDKTIYKMLTEIVNGVSVKADRTATDIFMDEFNRSIALSTLIQLKEQLRKSWY